MSAAPLHGIRVLDISRWIAGPHAGLILGDMGADVVKVETPSGDPSRLSGPHVNGESTYFMALNRNKRGVTVDTRSEAGLDLLGRLIAEADVLIENFRPGTLADMGFDSDRLTAINPGLVTVSVSGYGQTGPQAQEGCFDSVAQATSGLQSVTGQAGGPPVRAGFYVADYSAALHAALGAVLALFSRERDGRGQHVDVSLVESLLSLSATFIPGYSTAGVVPSRQGNRSIHAAPADVFETRDGFVQLSASTNSLFASLASAMARPDLLTDERYSTNALRLQNIGPLTEEISGWARGLDSEQMLDALRRARVPAGKVATVDDVLSNPQLRHREFFATIEHPVAGEVEFAGPVVRMSAAPTPELRPSPGLGQHNAGVLEDWLGLEAADVEQLRAQGAFGRTATAPHA
ncbi:CaiB/BaiF CoA-transferase family protein [Microbacterium sp. AK031]|uniref:CaiB/BaiF CoA transferase family protein n=1 Tax=Microbacterium sp. AK031 TaxID=2723076 RepID=UPI002169F890|nr:CoA transferase [Microbacterium sp. AK031]MCS3844033.1 CoA:oxalate CoA-transferase [Microbacterium sp. AK031]